MKVNLQKSSVLSGTQLRVPVNRRFVIKCNRVGTISKVVYCFTDSKKAQEPENLPQQLLFGAASLLNRGTSTCRTCKGQGGIQCSNCEGRGHVKTSHVNAVRRAVQRLQCIVDKDRCTYNTEWLQTNRCKQCHGTGYIPCEMCKGMGVRQGPQLSHKK